ncbi:MAG: hypothetical protein CL537_10215 [Alcanivoracaceae bacterium]|nr:hypothetical protein [Alcanivoracaceae bacterium]MCG8439199.1 hypothetical protein [Pseudomonadales bacterium]|tara:strand:- start:2756 stop:2971 length:216 start_codon:yes stop_codon:yes gene_type:complete
MTPLRSLVKAGALLCALMVGSAPAVEFSDPLEDAEEDTHEADVDEVLAEIKAAFEEEEARKLRAKGADSLD